MNLHIAEIRAHVLVDEWKAQLLQFLADFHHRRCKPAQAQYIAAQAMEFLNVALVQGAAHDVAFQFVDFGVDRFTHRLVVLDHEIEDGIEYEIFPVLQQQRTCLTTLADVGVGRRMTVACGNDVAVTGKNMGLDELEFAVFAYWRIRDDEQRIAEGFQLRAAVFFQGVFDGQFMQVELSLQIEQFLCVRLFETDPDKVTRLCRPGRAFVEGDIGDFLSSAVNRSSNNSTHGLGSLLGSFYWSRSNSKEGRGRQCSA
ncbi:hypothetical protein D3C87_1387440 [compost metagenome]